ncbi:helix-turn-helix transcriptional regulator [Rhodophyticola sp.]|jgi:predicted DNA-binding transcriptional regulator YafY|uniref:helix-turn-helix transcriptional regulator n=1 Tax=Rhodophyticola sp. TaxID=2680032 RepID=UPI003D275DC6
MRRTDRLFQIVQLLRSGKLLTARHLAEALEVSERTIYRDIGHLVGSGLPIDGEAGLGYLMRAGYDLPPLMFTTEEIVALTAGARMIQAWGGTAMVKGAEQALGKITSVLPEPARRRAEAVAIHAMPRSNMTEALRGTIDQLEAAVTGRERITITYRDEAGQETTRTVRPVGLWYWGTVWTLVGWCELRRDFRMFRLDRIGSSKSAGAFLPEPGQSLQDFYAQQLAQHGCNPDQTGAR